LIIAMVIAGVKAMTKKLDGQLEVKLDHDISIQKLGNDSKKLELDLLREKLREKLENKKPPPLNNGPKKATSLTLSEKKDFETHKAEVKRQSKDNDATRDKLKKDNKAADVRSNLGFAANMLQNRVNGGLWQTGTVADVSNFSSSFYSLIPRTRYFLNPSLFISFARICLL
jgi:hypothetical protein